MIRRISRNMQKKIGKYFTEQIATMVAADPKAFSTGEFDCDFYIRLIYKNGKYKSIYVENLIDEDDKCFEVYLDNKKDPIIFDYGCCYAGWNWKIELNNSLIATFRLIRLKYLIKRSQSIEIDYLQSKTKR